MLVIAQDLKIVYQITKQYNNSQLLSVLKINATNSNLEDFKLKDYGDQGIEEFSQKDSLKSIY
jgi:hypothetical protein